MGSDRVRKSSGKYMGSESGKVVASTWGQRESGIVVASTWGQSQEMVASTWGQTESGKVVRCGARITRVISRRYTGLRALGYPLSACLKSTPNN
jgi:acyl-coenzyme A synthetase/AMP-(fatty) acid ligase